MATLNYEFDGKNFEYEVDTQPYFDSLSDEDACELASEIYNEMSPIEQEDLKNEFGDEVVKFDPNIEESVNFSRAIIEDTDESTLVEKDEDRVTDFFENDAREQYEDDIAYQSDKYGYYGVNERDFY